MNVKDNEIRDLIIQNRQITVIGLSSDPAKPANEVPAYMVSHGFTVGGVNPSVDHIPGFITYKSLSEVPVAERQMIVVFRRPEFIPEVVREILALGGTQVLWLQLGITHPEAEREAESAGLRVVSNRCWLSEHRKYFSN